MSTTNGRFYRDPVRYQIGVDLSQDAYDELVVRVADWFREWRKDAKEPAADARHRIRCCLEGTTLEGQPWFSAWNSSFATRMRQLCRFDPIKMTPCRDATQKATIRKQKAKARETARQREAMEQRAALVPPLTRKEMGNLAYGDPAHAVLTESEQATWNEVHAAYITQFPTLASINAQGELSFLCDLHVVHERNRLRLLKGEKIEPAAMSDHVRSMVEAKKALGIHPDQLAKRTDEKSNGSIADAVRRLETVQWGREARAKAFLEEMLVLFQMYVTPSPRQDMGGYQLDDVGLFAHTKCRTCVCPSCGSRNFVGINFEEVRDYLVRKGVLEPLPIEVPNTRELPVLTIPIDLEIVETDEDEGAG